MEAGLMGAGEKDGGKRLPAQPRQCLINRFASVLTRCSSSFYDRRLQPHGVSAGMQIFLLRISENPGIATLELAEAARFDKGTTTRAVKRLVAQGLVRSQADAADKRVHRLTITKKALPVLEATYNAFADWEAVITQGLSGEEIALAERLMERVSDNAFRAIRESGGYR